MRSIAIVGAGQAGLQIAFGLQRHGYDVTLFSERTPEQILNSRLPATAVLFERGTRYEQELGISFWKDEAPSAAGAHFDLCIAPGQRVLTVAGRVAGQGVSVDLRLKFSRWLTEFERRGGKVVIQELGAADLDALASRHDLVLVASGKGTLSRLFPRDDARSVHTKPTRHIAAMMLSGVKPWPDVAYPVIKFILTATDGEIFWMPNYDRLKGPAVGLLVEAKPGSELDCLSDVKSGREAVTRLKALVHRFAPWADEVLKDAEVTDESAWLTGAFTPTVRQPSARLPSGGLVMGVGDAAILNDPVAGQGLNCASKMAHFVTEAILAHGARPFTEDWMREVSDGFWEKDGRWITAFSNLLLEPPPPHVQQVLGAASQVPAIADAFFDNFTEPQRFWPWIADPVEAQAFIQRMSAPRA